MSERFAAIAGKAASLAGSYLTFVVALGLVVIWAVSGPFFGFSEAWQLYINTTTTIVTFLMVFLIQNTQNRDSIALHIKLDELIRAMERADDALMEAEEKSEHELELLKANYRRIAESKGDSSSAERRASSGR